MKLENLHVMNPYAGFPLADWPQDIRGWNYDDELFGKLVARVRPQLAVEVGVWLGGSAIRTASAIRAQGLGGKLLCIDTWLGSTEFWEDQSDRERYQALRLEHGYPTCYYQFLANVLHAGLQETIIPFPQTSLSAATWFRKRGFVADMVYIDASHIREDVIADIFTWWENLRSGGVIFGDDFDWRSVRDAVVHCAKTLGGVEVINGKWLFHK